MSLTLVMVRFSWPAKDGKRRRNLIRLFAAVQHFCFRGISVQLCDNSCIDRLSFLSALDFLRHRDTVERAIDKRRKEINDPDTCGS